MAAPSPPGNARVEVRVINTAETISAAAGPKPDPASAARWVAVDSDGCVLDSMEPKQRACFVPALIEVWGLQEMAPLAASGYLRLNLHSEHRGANRFLALDLFWQWLFREVAPPILARLLPPLGLFSAWVRRGGPLSTLELVAESQRHPHDQGLALALRWTCRANELSASLPPPRVFANAPGALADAAARGPLHVVSSGPGRVIREEWDAAGLSPLVHALCPQEAGDKLAILRRLSAATPQGEGLMIGDALGDADAARAAGVLFFPILPGDEAHSWQRVHNEILPAFFSGRYTAADAERGREALRNRLHDAACPPPFP